MVAKEIIVWPGGFHAGQVVYYGSTGCLAKVRSITDPESWTTGKVPILVHTHYLIIQWVEPGKLSHRIPELLKPYIKEVQQDY